MVVDGGSEMGEGDELRMRQPQCYVMCRRQQLAGTSLIQQSCSHSHVPLTVPTISLT